VAARLGLDDLRKRWKLYTMNIGTKGTRSWNSNLQEVDPSLGRVHAEYQHMSGSARSPIIGRGSWNVVMLWERSVGLNGRRRADITCAIGSGSKHLRWLA
jgi:hypothetical protein